MTIKFSRVYCNCCCSCSFEAEIIIIGQSSHKIYNNNILNLLEPTTILNACTKKYGDLLNVPCSIKQRNQVKTIKAYLTSVQYSFMAL